MNTLVYVQGAELGDAEITWRDTNGALRQLASGWVFSAVVRPWRGGEDSFGKTSGFTGADDAPNLTVAWAAEGEVGDLEPGLYRLVVTAERDVDGKEAKLTAGIYVRAG